MAQRELRVTIVGDARSLERSLGRASKSARGFSSDITRSFAGISRAATVATAAVGAALATVAVKGVRAASDLNEEISKSNVLFGANADEVQAWSKTTATALGLSRRAALEAAGNFGAMFATLNLGDKVSAAMSQRLVGLGADLASFSNQDPSEMLDRLRAGLSGEAEPLRRFGILLSEARVKNEAYRIGLAKSGDELTEQQKVQARYSLILKDSAKAQGDFARTSTSLANAQRIAKAQLENVAASIGGVFLPVVAKGLSGFNDFIADISKARTARAKIGVVVSGLENIGREVLEQARRAFEAIDWQQAVADAREGLFRAIRSLGQVIGRIDWGRVGRELGRFIVTGFRQTAAFLRSVDWGQVGGAIVRGIVNFLKGVNWKALAVATIKLLVAALKANVQLMVGIGKELGRAFVSAIGSGVDSLKDFVVRKLLEFVNRILGVTSFLGRFDPFKGVRERIQRRLQQMEVDAAKAAAAIQGSIDGIKDRTVTITVKTVAGRAVDNPAETTTLSGAGVDSASQVAAQAAKAQVAFDLATNAVKAISEKAANAATQIAAARAKAAATAKKAAARAKAATDRQRAAFAALLEGLDLKADIARAKAGFKDDLAVLAAREKAVRDQIRIEGHTTALERELFNIRQERLQIRQQQRQQDRAARDARQFRTLGLGPEGQDLPPTIAALRKQAASIGDAIKGTFLDTPKTKGILARIRKALKDGVKGMSEDVRAAIAQMLANLNSQLTDSASSKGPITKFHKENANKLLQGLGLSPEQIKELRARLAGVGIGGAVHGSGQSAFGFATGGVGPGASAVGAQPPVPIVNVNVTLDGRQLEPSITVQQQKKSGRTTTTRTGRFAGV